MGGLSSTRYRLDRERGAAAGRVEIVLRAVATVRTRPLRMSYRYPRMILHSHPARLLGVAMLSLVAFSATPSAGRSTVSRIDALPRPAERLAHPVWLPNCGMNIVEWRSTAAFHSETSPSDEATAVIDRTCRAAFARYLDFLHAEHLPHMREQPNELPAISMLPGNVLLDGKSLRALNDLATRFDAVAPGCCYWGLYVDSLNHLFVRNDPLIRDEHGKLVENPRFVRTLTHEISHVLSSRLGVWDLVGYDRERDEDLAEAFVAFMGMKFPAESSAEDLAFHRGRLPFAPADGTAGRTAGEVAAATPAMGLTQPSAPRVPANASPQR